MNEQLKSAITELRRAGARGLPTPSKVMSASNGSSWEGKKANGDPWQLVKNTEESYNCMC